MNKIVLYFLKANYDDQNITYCENLEKNSWGLFPFSLLNYALTITKN